MMLETDQPLARLSVKRQGPYAPVVDFFMEGANARTPLIGFTG
jgi:hypothetical protein